MAISRKRGTEPRLLEGGPFHGFKYWASPGVKTLEFTAKGHTGFYNHKGIWTSL